MIEADQFITKEKHNQHISFFKTAILENDEYFNQLKLLIGGWKESHENFISQIQHMIDENEPPIKIFSNAEIYYKKLPLINFSNFFEIPLNLINKSQKVMFENMSSKENYETSEITQKLNKLSYKLEGLIRNLKMNVQKKKSIEKFDGYNLKSKETLQDNILNLINEFDIINESHSEVYKNLKKITIELKKSIIDNLEKSIHCLCSNLVMVKICYNYIYHNKIAFLENEINFYKRQINYIEEKISTRITINDTILMDTLELLLENENSIFFSDFKILDKLKEIVKESKIKINESKLLSSNFIKFSKKLSKIFKESQNQIKKIKVLPCFTNIPTPQFILNNTSTLNSLLQLNSDKYSQLIIDIDDFSKFLESELIKIEEDHNEKSSYIVDLIESIEKYILEKKK